MVVLEAPGAPQHRASRLPWPLRTRLYDCASMSFFQGLSQLFFIFAVIFVPRSEVLGGSLSAKVSVYYDIGFDVMTGLCLG